MENLEKMTGSALARGISILQAFDANSSSRTARELLEITGLPKPTLFRLAGTLCELGLLHYDEMNGRYLPAPGLARLAVPMLGRIHIRQLAFPPMQALADRYCAQVSLSLGLNNDLVMIDLAQSKDCPTVRPAMGTHLSLSRTASGRAYLTRLPKEQRNTVLSGLKAEDVEQANKLAERLLETQKELEERGFCVSHGDLQRELEAVAVPLRTHGEEIYVFACIAPSFELKPGQLLNEIGPRLVTLARTIEATLGSPKIHEPNF